ncbi:MAG: OmpA family protein [Romboutsia sp.]|nr:OmpA family protein [Romboutsia sp.]
MKKIAFGMIAIFVISLLYSCSAPKPTINNFTIDKDTVEVGQEVVINYNTLNSDKILLTYTNQNGSIDTINKNLDISNTYTFIPKSTGEFKLLVQKGDEVNTSFKKVLVTTPKPLKLDPPTAILVNESKDSSEYLKGIIPIDLAKNRDIFFDIFSYDRTGFPDSIKVFVTVRDIYGNFISNMATPYGSDKTEKKYFKGIVEIINNQRYEIESYDVVEHHDAYSKPYTFSLVLDHSGSMAWGDYPIEDLQSAALSFISQKKLNDKIGVIKFDHRIKEEVKISQDKIKIQSEYIPNLLESWGGGTSLYAASDFAIKQLSPYDDKIAILFTDGGDNSSLQCSFENDFSLAFSPLDLVVNARKTNTKLFTVGYGNANFDILSKISYMTDGKSFKANNGNEINDIINSLPKLFNNYYEITYKPKSLKGWRDIEISVSDNNSKNSICKGGTYIGEDYDFGEEPDIKLQVANFDYNKSMIGDDDGFIKSVLSFYKKHPEIVIELHGHTDSQGKPEYNKKLSLKRAKAIEKILIKKGIPKEKLLSIGHGAEYLIYNPELNEDQKRENRRVEAIIIRSGEFKKGYFSS